MLDRHKNVVVWDKGMQELIFYRWMIDSIFLPVERSDAT